MSTPKETVAEALVKYETAGMCMPGQKCQMCDCGVQNMDAAELREDLRRNADRAQYALAALRQHRDDIARAVALTEGLVNPPLSGRYGRYADAVLDLFDPKEA